MYAQDVGRSVVERQTLLESNGRGALRQAESIPLNPSPILHDIYCAEVALCITNCLIQFNSQVHTCTLRSLRAPTPLPNARAILPSHNPTANLMAFQANSKQTVPRHVVKLRQVRTCQHLKLTHPEKNCLIGDRFPVVARNHPNILSSSAYPSHVCYLGMPGTREAVRIARVVQLVSLANLVRAAQSPVVPKP